MAKYSHHLVKLSVSDKNKRTHLSLEVGIHSIICSTKTVIDTSTIFFDEQYIKIFIFVNLVCFLIHTFTTELVFGSKTVIGFRAQTNDSLSLPFYLKQTGGSFILGLVFCSVGSWEPVTFILLKFLVQLWSH